jgi:hypothetical protein
MVGPRVIDGAADEYHLTGLTNGASYNVRLQAVNAAGTSPLSTASNVVVPATGAPTVAIVTGGTCSRSFALPASNYRFEVIAINSVGNSVPSVRSELVSPR